MTKRFESVDVEISAGRLWRAKEILSGMMSGTSYDADLFEKMGLVLLEMGDDREAGKYLFLCGIRAQETQAATEIFLSKAQKGSFADFWSGMPARAKQGEFDELPIPVQQELAEMAFKQKDIDRTFEKYAESRARRAEDTGIKNSSPTLKGQIIGWLIFALAMILFVGFLYQAGLGVWSLWSLLTV